MMIQQTEGRHRRNTYHGERGNNRIQVNVIKAIMRVGNKEHEKLTSKKIKHK